MTVPKNVLQFEVALYLSLMLDTLSAAIQAQSGDAADPTYATANIVNTLFILGFVFLVGYAARQRKNWARMVLLAALALATFSLMATLASEGMAVSSAIDIVSVALTAYGLYHSFTGDARGWFNA